MNITRHYLERAHQRLGTSQGSSYRMVKNALKNGKRAEQLTSFERKYLLEKEKNGRTSVVVYQKMIYVFSEDKETCITVYQAPEWFSRKRYYDSKERIRQPKKYLRYCKECVRYAN